MKLAIDQALDKAVALHTGGDLQAAETLYRAILQEQPSQPEANHNIGLLAVSGGFAEEALPFFMTAIKSSPNTEQFWFSYIDCLIKGQNFEAAQRTLLEVREAGASPSELDSLEQQILDASCQNKGVRGAAISQPTDKTISSEKKRKKSAQKQRKKKESSAAREPLLCDQERLVGHFQAGEFDKAELIARGLTCDFPDHEFGWKALGAILKQTDRAEESIVVMRRSVQLAPQDSEAHYNLGCVLQELGRVTEAEACYSEAIVMKPDYAEAYCNLGVVLFGAGKLPEAEESCRHAISFFPGNPEAHCNLGNVLKDLGRLEEAEASYRQAVIANPEFVAAHSNLGVTLEELDKPEEAEASYSRAIAIDPDYAIARLNRAQLSFEKGQFEAALVDADFCDTDESRVRALEALSALGRYEEIYARIERYAEQDDTNIRMSAFSAFISEKLKKPIAHKFCPAPLSFFYSSSIAQHTTNADGFIAALVDELEKIETIWEPPRKSTTNGFQLPGSMNLFEQPRGKIAELETIICDELDNYFSEFKDDACSLISRWPAQKKLHGWHVVLQCQGYQSAHIHPGGWLSGVIYLKVVPTLDKDEGAIEFSLNGKNYSDSSSPVFTYRPSAGDIVLFPSSLHHRTIPFTTDADRIVVAFDLLPIIETYDQAETAHLPVARLGADGGSRMPEQIFSAPREQIESVALTHDEPGSKSPSAEQVEILLGYATTGKFVEAESLARSLTCDFPTDPLGWKILGVVLKLLDRTDESLGALKKLLELAPNDAEAHNNLGVLQRDTGRLVEAEESYRQALAIAPDYAEAHQNLGSTLRDLGKSSAAAASFSKAITLQPDVSDARFSLGVLLYESQQYAEAAREFASVETEKGKSYAVRCAYHLDDQSSFYDKLDTFLAQYPANAIIGAVSHGAERKYGAKRPNAFCNHPLNYVAEVSLLKKYDFMSVFAAPVNRVLSENVADRKQKLLYKGTQTAGNIFSHSEIQTAGIEGFLRSEIEAYRWRHINSGEGFIQLWPSSFEIYGWLIKMQSGGELKPHIHDDGWISGSIYINVPPKAEPHSGSLVLCLGDQAGGSKTEESEQSIIDVNTGSLCLFPSSLHHYTIPFVSSDSRIVLAFDVRPI